MAAPDPGAVLVWIDLTGLKGWPGLYAIELLPLKNAPPLPPGRLPERRAKGDADQEDGASRRSRR